jgi:hypothetical protein
MTEVLYMSIPVAVCSPEWPQGRAIDAWFTREGDSITLVNQDGEPIRDRMGRKKVAKVYKGQMAETVAVRLARLHWEATNDDLAESFNRPLRYGPSGVV